MSKLIIGDLCSVTNIAQLLHSIFLILLMKSQFLEFCRKEGVNVDLFEYVKGLIRGKKKIYSHCKAGVLRAVLAGIDDGTDA